MKTWAERIAEARERGGFTDDDISDMSHWNRCFVGEALAALGQSRLVISTEKSLLRCCEAPPDAGLRRLGGGSELPHPRKLMLALDFDGLERRRLQIRARAAELFGPSDESLIAATVEEAKKHAAEELVPAE